MSYLTRDGLTAIAAEYRRQEREALNGEQSLHDGAMRARGAAIAIEYLIQVSFESSNNNKETEPCPQETSTPQEP